MGEDEPWHELGLIFAEARATKPGTVHNQLFASLDWLPTLVDIAGAPTGDRMKKRIEVGQYPGIVKTTLDGVNQRDYQERNHRNKDAGSSEP